MASKRARKPVLPPIKQPTRGKRSAAAVKLDADAMIAEALGVAPGLEIGPMCEVPEGVELTRFRVLDVVVSGTRGCPHCGDVAAALRPYPPEIARTCPCACHAARRAVLMQAKKAKVSEPTVTDDTGEVAA